MASGKLVRDFLFSKRNLFLHLSSQQGLNTRLRQLSAPGYHGYRRFSVFNEFSKRIKGEVERNPEFKKSVKELKEKAEEVTEELKVRTKQTTEKLYKRVDDVWTDAESTAKKVSGDVKEKISAAKEEVKETFGIGKQESAGSTGASEGQGFDTRDKSQAADGEQTHHQYGSTGSAETIFEKVKSRIASPKVSSALHKLKEAKVIDLAKKGYDIVKDELSNSPSKRKHLEYNSSPSATTEKSTRTDIVIAPSNQSRWSKKWDKIKEKIQGTPLFKRINRFGEPVVTKGQEIAEDVRERWETSDSPIVHKIQDINETIFQETDAAASLKEIRRRDPSFSLPEFVAEIQEVIKPILNAYMKADEKTLKKYCAHEVIERCKAEHQAFQSHGIFFDNKILHISEVEVKETKMMGTSPIIIVAFQMQQIHCVRDRNGSITEGGKDTIHTIYYAWAMQQVDPEELAEGAVYPIWRLREMQKLGVQALI
ncbi:Translocase inner membrane subunit 44-2 isoform 1 [Tripterygium wilfordii]|uniref:Translocase inner membrane subunit 44-2 isoform 1 n=1 Tax=Tripterygium wilfordii TaxID=458696 RepID=A0A7J7DQX8_TRIWF|nr:mitochondrial import inner membrane translocase subunit TIM44-2-like [Tripterygium wilfordii]KAF5748574.1 Translocase inner membrane subunit 44-2 isoform 1 [Tripterygium wilfordii]